MKWRFYFPPPGSIYLHLRLYLYLYVFLSFPPKMEVLLSSPWFNIFAFLLLPWWASYLFWKYIWIEMFLGLNLWIKVFLSFPHCGGSIYLPSYCSLGEALPHLMVKLNTQNPNRRCSTKLPRTCLKITSLGYFEVNIWHHSSVGGKVSIFPIAPSVGLFLIWS